MTKNIIWSKRKKSRIGVIVLIVFTMVMTSSLTAVGSSFHLNNQPSLFANQLSYSFEFKAPNAQTIQANGASYTSLSLPGCLSIGRQTGEPTMPVKPISLMLPPMRTISQITVVGTPITITPSTIDLSDKPVIPYQPSVPFGSDQQPEFVMNMNIYSSDALYPTARYSDYTVGYSHGYAIATINLNPVQYNPQQGTLLYYPEMTVVLSLKAAAPSRFFRGTSQDAAWVKGLVSNPEVADLYSRSTVPTFRYSGGLCDTRTHYDYVIVAPTEYGLNRWNITGSLTYNWTSLLNKHLTEGLVGTVVTKQAILANHAYMNTTDPLFNDTQARIRNFCRDAYLNWGTQYVLFVGDSVTLPARLMSSSAESSVDADIYWSNLDNTFNADHDSSWGEEGDNGFDLYTELYIGRVTADSPQDCSNWLTKVFYYMDSSDPDYLDNLAFYGGDTGWACKGDDFEDYSGVKGTNDWLGPNPHYSGPFPTWVGFQYGFETWNAVNRGNQYNLSIKWSAESPMNPGWNGGSTSAATAGLRNDISNDRVTIISGIAHANPQMSLDVQYTSWESQYTNTKPFFIHDYGCHCGDFSGGGQVLHSMLFHSKTELAFGCVYNTGYGWGNNQCTNSSSAFQQKEFWSYFLDVENKSKDFTNWQFGKGQAYSKDRMAPTIIWGGTWREIIQCCLLFGDPALTMRTPHPSQPPTKPTLNGPTLAIWHQEYSYTSVATDPENDQIFYLFNWADGSTSGWLGPYASGQTVTATHIWTVLGVYNVTVKARDVWGSGSPWSDPLVVTVTDNTPPTAPTIVGPSQGKPGLPYLFDLNTTDLQNQDVYYYIEWGDNTTSGWLGPYICGAIVHVTHTWTQKGDYVVRAKAKDIFNAESNWTTLHLSMPLDLIFIGGPSSQQFLATQQSRNTQHQLK